MLVIVHATTGEEFARNNVDRVEFTKSDGHEVDQFFEDAEVETTLVIINLDNVIAVGMQPNVDEAEVEAKVNDLIAEYRLVKPE